MVFLPLISESLCLHSTMGLRGNVSLGMGNLVGADDNVAKVALKPLILSDEDYAL